MRTSKYVFLLVAAGVIFELSGCGIYGNYKRPENTPASGNLFRDSAYDKAHDSFSLAGSNIAVESKIDTSSLATLSWRELFKDKKLQVLIDSALRNNTDLLTAQLKVSEAEATLKTSRLAFLPSLSLGSQGELSSFDGARPAKTYNLDGSASWELDIFGRLHNANKQAAAAFQKSYAYKDAVQTKLIASVADGYYYLLLLDEELAITEQTVETWQENVKTMNALKAAGETTQAAVSQSEASLYNTQASVVSLKQQIQKQENSLSTLLGIEPQSIIRGTMAEQEFPAELSAGVPLQMINRRPDVLEAEYALKQAFYGINAARSAFYPSLVLSGSAGWTNSSGMAIINPGKLLLTAIGSLSQPIFNNGKNVEQLKIAKAQQDEAMLAYKQKILDAGADVNNALTQWQSAQKKYELDTEQVKSLQSAVRSTSLLMQHGTVNYLEVITAKQTLLQAQISLITDRYDEISGVINLFHALGGGANGTD